MLLENGATMDFEDAVRLRIDMTLCFKQSSYPVALERMSPQCK